MLRKIIASWLPIVVVLGLAAGIFIVWIDSDSGVNARVGQQIPDGIVVRVNAEGILVRDHVNSEVWIPREHVDAVLKGGTSASGSMTHQAGREAGARRRAAREGINVPDVH